MGSIDDALIDARNESYEEGYAHGVSDARRRALSLIRDKKREYETAAPSITEGRGEREAVIAALETLHAHARTKLDPESLA